MIIGLMQSCYRLSRQEAGLTLHTALLVGRPLTSMNFQLHQISEIFHLFRDESIRFEFKCRKLISFVNIAAVLSRFKPKTNSDFQVAFEFDSLRCTSLLPSVSSFSFLHEVKEYSAKQIISAYQLVNHDGILALFALKRTPPCACTTILKME